MRQWKQSTEQKYEESLINQLNFSKKRITACAIFLHSDMAVSFFLEGSNRSLKLPVIYQFELLVLGFRMIKQRIYFVRGRNLGTNTWRFIVETLKAASVRPFFCHLPSVCKLVCFIIRSKMSLQQTFQFQDDHGFLFAKVSFWTSETRSTTMKLALGPIPERSKDLMSSLFLWRSTVYL